MDEMKKLRNLGLAGILLFGCTEANPDYNGIDVPKEVVDGSIKEDDFGSQEDLAQKVDGGSLEDLSQNQNVDLPNVDADEDSGEDLPDFSYKDQHYQDFTYADLLKEGDMAQQPDLVQQCYNNNFSKDSDLDNLLRQNGTWTRNQIGYLEQTDRLRGLRTAYFKDRKFTDVEIKVRINVSKGDNPGLQHAGFTFRYNQKSQIGFDPFQDFGYVLEVEEMDGQNATITLVDWPRARLDKVRRPFKYDTWYEFGVLMVGNKITYSFEGKEINTIQNNAFVSGYIGFETDYGPARFDDLQICEK